MKTPSNYARVRVTGLVGSQEGCSRFVSGKVGVGLNG